MSAFGHHVAYELRASFRDKAQLLMNYLFPLAFTAIMGALMGQVNPFFKERMIPAMTVFSLMSPALMFLPTTIVGNRLSGVYRSLKINAVPKGAVLGAPVAAMALNGVLVTAVVAAAGALAFGAPLPAEPLRFCVAWAASFLAISGLGTLIGVLAPTDRAAILMAQLFFIPSILLGGLMMPEGILPESLGLLSLAFPATHAMGLFLGGGDDAAHLAFLLLVGAACYALAARRFAWTAR